MKAKKIRKKLGLKKKAPFMAGPEGTTVIYKQGDKETRIKYKKKGE